MTELKPIQYHRTIKRKSCVPAPHVHCQSCDKAIIVSKSYLGGATEALCRDCQKIKYKER
jgi:predicted nucleic acid-binding Zn ribbon protein